MHSTPYNLVFTPTLLFSSPFFFLLRPLRMLPQYKTQMASFHLLPFLPSWQMVWFLYPKQSRKFLLLNLQGSCGDIMDIFLALFLPELSAEFETQGLEGPLGGSGNSIRWIIHASIHIVISWDFFSLPGHLIFTSLTGNLLFLCVKPNFKGFLTIQS